MDRHRPIQDLKWCVKENYEKILSLRCRRVHRRPPFGRLRASLVKKLKRTVNIMKIFITGGAGYIGSVLIPMLLDQKFKVTVFDSLLYGGSSLLSFVSNPNFSFIKGDVRDKKTLSYALNNNDLIMHLAAIVGLSACNRDPKLAHSTNVEGTKNIVDLLSPSQIFIFASTVSNYGAALGNSCKEDTPLNPLSLYAKTKT